MLRMEDMDDFGDLYADLEVSLNAGVESVDHLYRVGKKNEGNSNGIYNSNSLKKDVEMDSESEELILCDQIHQTNVDDEKASSKDSESDPGDENLLVEDGSESEDDLHIVLNEEDCRSLPNSKGVGFGNGGRVGGSDDDEDGDDLVIVTKADHLSKDRRPMDGLEQSMGPPCGERGNAAKGAYVSQYSQFKYVRPHAAAIPSNLKTSGSAGVVSFSSPVSCRCNSDVDGGNQQMMSCSGLDTSANLGIHTRSQKRFDFHLPRNRTILDVSIDTFKWKPWRYPGVDITDFFNFGLDEESWKSYCESLEHFRKQSAMLTKIPVYQSSGPNQAYEDEFLQKTEASEGIAAKLAQTEQGDRVSSMSKNVCWSARSFEIPKGRAIQVEDGIGERLASIDVRRPRYQDSDVVIQIPMQDATEDTSVSNEKQVEHVDELSRDAYKNGALGMKDAQSMQHHGSAHGDLVAYHHQEVMEPVSKETDEELATVDRRDTENLSKDEKVKLDSDSASCHQIQCNLSPSNPESHSEASKAGVVGDMGIAGYHVSRPSSSSLSGSGHHRSNTDSRSDSSKAEYKGNKNSSPKQHLAQGGQIYYGGGGRYNLAESEIPMDSAKASTQADGKRRYNEDHLRRGSRKGGQHSYYFDDNDSLEIEFCYGETELPNGYHGRRYAEKHGRRNSSIELTERKSKPPSQEKMEPYIRRHWDGREYLDERIIARNDDSKQRAYNFRERGRCNGGMSAFSHKESDLLISENYSFQSDRERYLQMRRIESDRRFKEEVEDDDYVFERRYKEEFIRERHVRHVLHYGREDFIQEKYGKLMPHLRREKLRPNREERDAWTPCFDMFDSWRYEEEDDRYIRSPDHELLSHKTCREVHIADGRGWHDSSPPRNLADNPWRSNGRCADQWRSGARYADHWRSNDRYANHRRMPDSYDKQSNKCREEDFFFVEGKEYHCQSRHRRDIDFDEDSYHAGKISVYHDNDVREEQDRYRCQWTDEEASLGHLEPDGSYDPEASFVSSRHEIGHLDHDSAHGRKHLDDFCLERRIRVKKSVHPKASKCISSTSDIADWGKREATALRCKEPINLHLNGWEGKVKLGKPKLSLNTLYHFTCVSMESECPITWAARYPRRYSEDEVRETRYDNTAYVDNDERMALRQCGEVITKKAARAHISKAGSNGPHGVGSKVEIVGHCNSERSHDVNNEKWLDKFPIVQYDDDSGLEEGQLPEEPEDKEDFKQLGEKFSEKREPSLSVKVDRFEGMEEINSQPKDATDDSKNVGRYDNSRILETLAKMERRRQRFKEPIALKKEPERILQTNSDIQVETAEVRQQRPARKRRWGGL